MKINRILHNFSSKTFLQTIRKMSVPTVKLNDGNQMPVIGLGTYLVKKKYLKNQKLS